MMANAARPATNPATSSLLARAGAVEKPVNAMEAANTGAVKNLNINDILFKVMRCSRGIAIGSLWVGQAFINNNSQMLSDIKLKTLHIIRNS